MITSHGIRDALAGRNQASMGIHAGGDQREKLDCAPGGTGKPPGIARLRRRPRAPSGIRGNPGTVAGLSRLIPARLRASFGGAKLRRDPSAQDDP